MQAMCSSTIDDCYILADGVHSSHMPRTIGIKRDIANDKQSTVEKVTHALHRAELSRLIDSDRTCDNYKEESESFAEAIDENRREEKRSEEDEGKTKIE